MKEVARLQERDQLATFGPSAHKSVSQYNQPGEN